MSEGNTIVAGGGAGRPGVLSLNIRERTALYAAFMPWVDGGGIFIPTTRPYKLGDMVFMLLSLMDDANRIAAQGKVVWVTPAGVQGNRAQGIGVQFTKDETGQSAKARIEGILGSLMAQQRTTHTM
jgi:type IV pilus assembly protein PilZ